ncbi:MAG: ribosome maturation factor RimP [Firmicutes bacterium]|nr:ribosome maturation factor RimP [Bacillota bacterium]
MEIGIPVAENLGYELIDVEYRKEGADWVLRCVIDCPAGVGLNECQKFSEALGKQLDQEDPIPGSYLLEVTSPGPERPLKKDADFIRFTGRKAFLKLFQPLNGSRNYQGELLDFRRIDQEHSLIKLGINNTQVEIPGEMVAKARLVPEFPLPEGGNRKK